MAHLRSLDHGDHYRPAAGQPPATPSPGERAPAGRAEATREAKPVTPAPTAAAPAKGGAEPPIAIDLYALVYAKDRCVVDDSLSTAGGAPTISTISDITVDLQ